MKREPEYYQLIYGTRAENLEEQVNAFYELGWKAHGSVYVDNDGWWIQAMVKDANRRQG